MGAVGTITLKDLRQRLRDRSALMIAFVVPLGLAFVFNLLFGGLDQGGLGRIDLGVVDRDGGPVGEAFTDQFLPAVGGMLRTGETDLQVTAVEDAGTAQDGVDAGDLDVAVVIPAGTTTRLQDAEAVTFEVLTHADRALVGDVVESLTDEFVRQTRGQLAARVLAERAQLSDDQARELADAVAGVQSRIRLDQSLQERETMDLSTYLTAGMAIFFLFFTVQFGVLGYLEERETGTLARLLAAPVTRGQVLAAKALVSLIVGVVATGALLAVAVPVLGASWGAPLPVALLVVAAAIAATSLVLLVGGLARTAEQANVWQSAIAVILGMLGGSFFPVGEAGSWLARISLVTPHAWFLRGLREVVRGGGVVDVALPLGVLLAFGAVSGLAGILLTRREVAP